MSFSQIKSNAWEHLKGKWGIAILAMIIANLISSAPNMLVQLDTANIIDIHLLIPILRILSFVSLVLLPIIVGYNRVHLDIAEELDPDLDQLFYGFRNGNFGRSLLSLFMRSVFLFLWYLLLIIPGIVKSFSYAMTSYILADPALSHLEGLEPITESRRLMDGHKFEYFLLILSIIWWILPVYFVLAFVVAFSGSAGAIFTFVSIFAIIITFVIAPYIEQVTAEYYLSLVGERGDVTTQNDIFAPEHEQVETVKDRVDDIKYY